MISSIERCVLKIGQLMRRFLCFENHPKDFGRPFNAFLTRVLGSWILNDLGQRPPDSLSGGEAPAESKPSTSM